jgi:hypothetical protein
MMADVNDISDSELLYAFPDQSGSFVHGFEAGQLSVEMRAKEAVIDRGYEEGFPIHTANVELLARMCACYGYTMETQPTEYAEWTAARMTLNLKPRPALTVVT